MTEYGTIEVSKDWLKKLESNQKKEWVGLTDDEIKNSMQGHNTQVDFARAIEAKLKERNT